MKTRRGMKLLVLALAAAFALAAMPHASLAAGDYEVTGGEGFKDPSTPASGALKPGEVWVERTAKLIDGSKPRVTLSAMGQQYYSVKAESSKPNNVVFVLDISGSMGSSGKLDNMISSANLAVQNLVGNGNKMALVTFSGVVRERRGLSENAFTLTKGAGNEANDIYNISADGGTNIQAGLKAAYGILKDQNSSNATPVIILLSDGAPTYYYNNITNHNTTALSYEGDGSYTSRPTVGKTIAQGMYLKKNLSGLRIFTIAFDTGEAAARLALNPTKSELTSTSGFFKGSGNYYKRSVDGRGNVSYSLVNGNFTYKDIMDYSLEYNSGITGADLTSFMDYNNYFNYVDEAYTATNGPGNLGNVLNKIIASLKVAPPVSETKVSQGGGQLTDSSYIKITDNIGVKFKPQSTATVTYEGQEYPFTYNNESGKYKYTGDNATIKGIIIEYDTENNRMIWKLPGGALPCRAPDGSGSAVPIRLSYTLDLKDEGSITDGDYKTISSKSKVEFTPTSDNLFYASNRSETGPSGSFSNATADSIKINGVLYKTQSGTVVKEVPGWGYIVEQTVENGNGTRTVTRYEAYTAGPYANQVRTIIGTFSGASRWWDFGEGETMTLISNNIISNVALTTPGGASVTRASMVQIGAGKGYGTIVRLSFTAKSAFYDLDFGLSAFKPNAVKGIGVDPLGIANYAIVTPSAAGGLTPNDKGLFSASKGGDYYIDIKLIQPYTSMPGTFFVCFDNLSYKALADSKEIKVLPHEEDYIAQNVRVEMTVPTKH